MAKYGSKTVNLVHFRPIMGQIRGILAYFGQYLGKLVAPV